MAQSETLNLYSYQSIRRSHSSMLGTQTQIAKSRSATRTGAIADASSTTVKARILQVLVPHAMVHFATRCLRWRSSFLETDSFLDFPPASLESKGNSNENLCHLFLLETRLSNDTQAESVSRPVAKSCTFPRCSQYHIRVEKSCTFPPCSQDLPQKRFP